MFNNSNDQLTHKLRLTIQKLKRNADKNTTIVDTNDVGNICRKIIFKYKKDSPFLLEFHLDKQKAEELKKQIEGDTSLAIEIEIDNAKYKYTIEEVHSCEISEDALKIKFYGEIYQDGNQLADEHLKCFTCTIVKEAEQVKGETHGNKLQKRQVPDPQKKTHTLQSGLNDLVCITLVCWILGLTSIGCVFFTINNPSRNPTLGGFCILGAVLLAAVLVGNVAMATCAKKKANPEMDTGTAVRTVLGDTFVPNYQRGAQTPQLVD